jgi:arabinan endo-1,5-alpha-L-arabinosidase
VYRYEGGKEWKDCGEVSKGFRTTSLASYKGRLYAGDDYAACYRYEGETKWSSCGRLGTDWKIERMFNTTAVFRGDLYAASLPGIYRFDGESKWESIGQHPFGTTQVHKLQVYDRHLWAGTWPYGKVLRYEGQDQWTDCGQLGIATDKYQINEVNDLTVFNGKLYAGVIPKGEVYRYEGGTEWTLLRRLLVAPNYSPAVIASWSRVPCMAPFQGRLFMGTGMCEGRYYPDLPVEAGRVYAMEAGKNVSYDDDLGTGWKHLVVTRDGGLLKLYVNGELRGTSSAFDNSDYDLSNRNPLRIGLGAQNNFQGLLDDFQIYEGALSPGQIRDLSRKGGTH